MWAWSSDGSPPSTAASAWACGDALLSVALTTRRQLRELAGLRWSAVQLLSDGRVKLTWERTKGGGVMYDPLPGSTTRALLAYLHHLYEPQLGGLPHDAPVWNQ